MSNWYKWELELIQKLINSDADFAELYKKHRELEEKVDELERKVYLTSQQEIELRRLKREKLRIRDQIEEILRANKKVVLPA